MIYQFYDKYKIDMQGTHLNFITSHRQSPVQTIRLEHFPLKAEMNVVNQHRGALCIAQLQLVLL